MAIKELIELDIDEISLVDLAANKRIFVCLKQAKELKKQTALGVVVRGARESRDFMTRDALAAKLPITVEELEVLEAGGPVKITPELPAAISEALGIKVEEVKALADIAQVAAVEQAIAIVEQGINGIQEPEPEEELQGTEKAKAKPEKDEPKPDTKEDKPKVKPAPAGDVPPTKTFKSGNDAEPLNTDLAIEILQYANEIRKNEDSTTDELELAIQSIGKLLESIALESKGDE
ncbi:hypothetical protein LCGC14_2383870 [marine sediment metagenome]|uniref:Uncharacterized protein n=1 Tax=marine sediment metagenome TaxID=412755 RepID=A0A0F9ECG2_9ZZZZ